MAPNSLVESLACGRPVLATEVVGLAGLLRENRAGVVCSASAQAIAESLDRIEAEWHVQSRNARQLAERWFGVELFLGAYERLYAELLNKRVQAN
jgi:glycosyltransferase involved in cell wall biosynthesis